MSKRSRVVTLLVLIVVAIILFYVVNFGILIFRLMKYHDYALPLPNGYELYRLNSYDVCIVNLADNKRAVDTLIYEIAVYPDAVAGKRGAVVNRRLSDHVEYFWLDTISGRLDIFDTSDKLVEFARQNYAVKNISMSAPRDLFNSYSETCKINNKTVSLGSYTLLASGKSYYIQSFDKDVGILKVNPTEIIFSKGMIIGFSANANDLYRGNDIIEGYFIIPAIESDNMDRKIHLGLSEESYRALLQEYDVQDIKLVATSEFIYWRN